MTIGKTIKTKYGDLTLKVDSYSNNKRLAVLLYTQDGELFDDLTINLSDEFIVDIDGAFINDSINSSEFDVVDILKNEGIIEESYGFRNYNFGKYELVRFNSDKLEEYDKEGYMNFLKQYGG